jgi:hypothetical protein
MEEVRHEELRFSDIQIMDVVKRIYEAIKDLERTKEALFKSANNLQFAICQ